MRRPRYAGYLPSRSHRPPAASAFLLEAPCAPSRRRGCLPEPREFEFKLLRLQDRRGFATRIGIKSDYRFLSAQVNSLSLRFCAKCGPRHDAAPRCSKRRRPRPKKVALPTGAPFPLSRVEAAHATPRRLPAYLQRTDPTPGPQVLTLRRRPKPRRRLRFVRVRLHNCKRAWAEKQSGFTRFTSPGGDYVGTNRTSYDADVGMYHFAFRSYSPELGRWMQRDPLGYVDGVPISDCSSAAAPKIGSASAICSSNSREYVKAIMGGKIWQSHRESQ